MLLSFLLNFLQADTIGGIVGLVCVAVLGVVLGHKLTSRGYSKKLSKQNFISASQVRELYRQIGRTPTEKQIKQMLAAVNSK